MVWYTMAICGWIKTRKIHLKLLNFGTIQMHYFIVLIIIILKIGLRSALRNIFFFGAWAFFPCDVFLDLKTRTLNVQAGELDRVKTRQSNYMNAFKRLTKNKNPLKKNCYDTGLTRRVILCNGVPTVVQQFKMK